MFNGIPGHEIVRVYDGVLKDLGLYEQAEIAGHEANIDEPFKAVWKRSSEFVEIKSTLYPSGFLELMR